MNKTVIIQGSSKSKGDTNTIINYFNSDNQFDFIDLKTKNISHFDYDFKNKNDDFLSLISNIIENYDTIIFTTPVYWFSMSGILKVFFDRFEDLLLKNKEIGRKLHEKNMAMISVSNSNDLHDSFAIPFKEIARYLEINYLGDVHAWIEDGEINADAKILLDKFRYKFQQKILS